MFFAFAGSLAFLAAYLLLARGLRTQVGRALITLDIGLALALGPSVIHRLFGLSLASLAFSWYFVASIALVGIAAWWLVWFVIKVQWRGRRKPPRGLLTVSTSRPPATPGLASGSVHGRRHAGR